MGDLATKENTDKDGVTTINKRGLKPGYVYVTPYVTQKELGKKGRQCEHAIQKLLGPAFTIEHLDDNYAACTNFPNDNYFKITLQIKNSNNF